MSSRRSRTETRQMALFDDDPERFAEDGGNMPRPKRRATKKRTAKKQGAAKKGSTKRRPEKRKGSGVPATRTYKTRSGHRYELRRLPD